MIQRILDDDHVPSQEQARILALCNLALSDAGSVCWAAKYYYRLVRPVVLIRQRGVDWRPFGGPRTNPLQFALGRDGQALQRLPYRQAAFTPNFPGYPSGHASFGGAAFGILRKLRGEYVRGDPERLNPNLRFVSEEVNGVSIDNFVNRPRPYVPRTFQSLTEVIHDVNRSRIHLGVHWNFDCKYGAQSGLKVADVVYRQAYRRQGRERYPEVSKSKRERRNVARR
jgi:hypothetical protein